MSIDRRAASGPSGWFRMRDVSAAWRDTPAGGLIAERWLVRLRAHGGDEVLLVANVPHRFVREHVSSVR